MARDRVHGAGQRCARQPLVLLLAVEGFSQTAFAMAQVTLPWFVLKATDNAALMGSVMLVLFAPAFVGSWLGGRWVDRYGAARTSLHSEVISAATMVLLATLALTSHLSLVTLLALLVASALVDPAGFIAREALIPPLARLAHLPLARANALRGWVTQSVQIGAPIAAGLIITYAGLDWAWAGIAAATVGAAALNTFLLAGRAARRPAQPRATAGRDAKDTVAPGHALADPVLRLLLLFTVPLVAITEPLESVVLPAYMFRAGESALALGGLDAAFNAGALLGIALYGWRGSKLGGRRLLLWCALTVSATLLVFAAQAPYLVLVGAAGLCGVAGGAVGPFLTTQVQTRAPRAARGRALAAMAMFEMGGAVVGIAVAAGLIEWIGTSRLLIGFAVLAAGTAVLMRRLPKDL